MAELLLEIGVEEIPSADVRRTLSHLADRVPALLEEAGLQQGESNVRVYGTPRRLIVIADGLCPALAAEQVWDAGPPLKVAYDADGQPTKAAEGFARGKGLTVGDLEERDGRIGVLRSVPERPATEVLTEPLTALIGALPWPKTMRWGSGSERFARPVHWLVALVDGEVIPISLGRVRASNTTYGHRFASPSAITVSDAEGYLEALRAAHVEPDGEVRKESILAGAEALAAEASGRLVPDPANALDNAYLTEWPLPVQGTFDANYLEVPREVLVDAMRSHQRYFAVEDASGKLLPCFIAVNNTPAKDPAVVVAGHQRVLRARLADARFFWDEDRKRTLDDRVDDLRGVIFLAKLDAPTVLDKTARIETLAKAMAPTLDADVNLGARAARLCKADLTTLMVQEFPDLQGVMGRYYARAAGEPPTVAAAIEEHYQPRGAEDALPASAVGAVVALADRLDTLVAGFACGLKPTGSKDAYGLRRAALGVLRILRDRDLALPISELVQRAADALGEDVPVAELKAFILDRLRHQIVGEGIPNHVADAVLAAGHERPRDVVMLSTELAKVVGDAALAPLFEGLKRVRNIVKKAGDEVGATVDSDGFVDEAERRLYGAISKSRTVVVEALANRDFASALEPLLGCKEAIDGFFDAVMVMDPDPALRKNRLALCKATGELFFQVADFSRIQVGKVS